MEKAPELAPSVRLQLVQVEHHMLVQVQRAPISRTISTAPAIDCAIDCAGHFRILPAPKLVLCCNLMEVIPL